MNQITQEAEQFVSVARAAALLGVPQSEVTDLLARNEIESLTLILPHSLRAYMADSAGGGDGE